MHERYRRQQVGLGRLRGLDYEQQWCLRETACGAPASSWCSRSALKTGSRKNVLIIPVLFALGQLGCCGATVVLRSCYVQYFVSNRDFQFVKFVLLSRQNFL